MKVSGQMPDADVVGNIDEGGSLGVELYILD